MHTKIKELEDKLNSRFVQTLSPTFRVDSFKVMYLMDYYGVGARFTVYKEGKRSNKFCFSGAFVFDPGERLNGLALKFKRKLKKAFYDTEWWKA